jgi:signal transduction histidine kinase/ActR/RegA family two-component response regulator
MIADWEFLGEVVFNFSEERKQNVLPQEMSGFVQISALTAAALNRLDLNAKLKERAERLASAMHKIKQINLKLMQTERLASVGQLAAGAAHEINNPLAIIYARAQLLEMRENDEGKKKNFRQMMEQIERITSILNNLMDFAKPSAPVMEKIDLNEVLERALSFVLSGLEKRRIKVSTSLDKDLPRIDGDPRRLEQVFLNLLINAEHALEDKGEEAKIKVVTAVDTARSVVTAAVSDNGVGIPKDNLRKIFDPFFTTKEEGKGTGLGLSTSYGIVSSHYGDIKVRSIMGKGTTMMVELPMDRAHAKENAEKAADAESILVVDDEQTVRELLEEALRDQGYDVDAVADAEEGLRMLREKKYNLLLLDIRMPGMGGLSFLSKVKDFTGDMPVVILTGMAGKDEIDKALDLGARTCIQKPFQMEPFLSEVRDIIEGEKKKDGGVSKNAVV